jgi:acyl-CoA synthetase (AMP-forming)/AMP-acid ligase II
MNVVDILDQSLRSSSGKAALISGVGKLRRQLTFAELECEVDDLVSLFRSRDLAPGDKVLLAVPVSIETFVAMLAILKAGLVVMFIDPAHGAAEVARCLRAHPPSAIIGTRAMLLLRFLSPEIGRIPVRIVAGTRAGAKQASLHAENRSSEDSALLTFTSGSTGQPKAVVRTHGFLRRQLDILNRVACPQPEDIDFVAMPMFVLFNLANATTSVIPACDMKRPGRADPRVLLAQLRAESATTVVASPALLERLANYCLRKRQFVPALRSISTGGGPVSPTLPDRLMAVAPNARIRSVYGSTEAEPIASVVNDEISIADRHAMRVGAGLLAGRPVSGCDTRIIPSRNGVPLGPCSDAEFDAFTLADGEIGEIVVSGQHVLSGYADPLRNRESKIEVGRRRWHRTGDAGYFDTKGRLWLVGRCAAAIRDSRGIVYPFQVEYAVSAVRGISRAALIPDHGKRVLVLETSAREFSSDCIKAAHCIADKQIDKIITVRRIPMDRRHEAKVDYAALNQRLEGCGSRLQLFLVATSARLYREIRDRITAFQTHLHAK